MANLRTAKFTLTGMTTERSLDERLRTTFNVKDFGAIGNGFANDTAAIQAAFDEAYGPAEDPHGLYTDAWTERFLNKVVFFPSGDYKVDETLKLNKTTGIRLLGAGSYQSRIFFDPGADAHDPGDFDGVTSLLECRMCYNITIEGLTLDAGGVQQCAMRSMVWPPSWDGDDLVYLSYTDDGTGGYYRDLHLTNGTFHGFFTNGILVITDGKMGSERNWFNCRFTNNGKFGHFMAQGNALNHSFYNCYFANNQIGMKQTQGGCGTVWACRFENNSVIDITQKQGRYEFVGCHSTSQNFCNADGSIISCIHDNASEGLFWASTYFHGGQETDFIPLPGALDVNGTDSFVLSAKGNISTNGIFWGSASTGSGNGTGANLVGNTFGNPDYMTGATGHIYEDGAPV